MFQTVCVYFSAASSVPWSFTSDTDEARNVTLKYDL